MAWTLSSAYVDKLFAIEEAALRSKKAINTADCIIGLEERGNVVPKAKKAAGGRRLSARRGSDPSQSSMLQA